MMMMTVISEAKKNQIWYADAVTINRLHRNRKYDSNMASVRFLKSEVIITQQSISYLIEIFLWRLIWTVLIECRH